MSHESVRLFISYSHVDEDWQRKIAEELELLDIDVWVDRQIKPGDLWQLEIERELESADIILLLISRDFLRSEFVKNEELPRALARLQDQDQPARVVPVLLRETTWKRKFDIAGLQAIPSGERWLKGWDDEDAAIRSVAKELEVIVEEVERLREQRKDNEENYRKAVAEALADDDEISVWEERTLEEERQRLNISPAVAEEIVAAERRRVEAKLENIRAYEEDIAIAIRRVGRPFDDKTREELKVRKSKLELRDDDVAGLEERVATRLEAELEERSNEEARRSREEAERQAPEEAERQAPEEAERLTAKRELVVRALLSFAGESDVHVMDAISEKKLRNARSKCNIPEDECVAGIINLTVMGSAKDCIAFTELALYYHSMGDRQRILYSDLKSMDIKPKGMMGIRLGPDVTISINGSSLSKKTAIAIIEAVVQHA